MSFKDIKGQDKPIEILKGYVKRSAIPGSYLFVGEEGIGKHQVALNFAKALNCLNLKDDACDSCISCMKIDKHHHPDIHCIESEGSDAIKIEDIRTLKKEISLKPYEARKKVFIVNNAHLLTADAANAILKILEEPPQDSLIILVSAKPALLFKTILSRCQIVRFYPLGRAELEAVLKNTYHLETSFAHFLAYFCEGRFGAANRLKDTDIMREKNLIIDEFTLLNRSGFLDDAGIRDRENIRHSLNVLAGWFRDLYLVKIGAAHTELIHLDRKVELLKTMGRYTLLDLDEVLHSISEALFLLEHNINTKLLLSNLKVNIWRG